MEQGLSGKIWLLRSLGYEVGAMTDQWPGGTIIEFFKIKNVFFPINNFTSKGLRKAGALLSDNKPGAAQWSDGNSTLAPPASFPPTAHGC